MLELMMLGLMIFAVIFVWRSLVSHEVWYENWKKRPLPVSKWPEIQEVLSRQRENASKPRTGRAANDKRP